LCCGNIKKSPHIAVVLMIAALISTAAIAVAVYAGTFRFLGA